MKNTPETRKAIEAIAQTARIKNTVYQIRIGDYDDDLFLTVLRPRDTVDAAYPEIFCKDDWYGEKALGFQIATTGYGDHSIRQAKRALRGLEIAIDLVEAMYTTAELYGLPIHR